MAAKKRKPSLAVLQKKLGYTFKNIKLFEKALNPKPKGPNQEQAKQEHQRMENVGDAYLSVVVREWAYNNFSPDAPDFHTFTSKACSNVILALVAENLGIVTYVKNNDVLNQYALMKEHADIMEAIFFAIILDGGDSGLKHLSKVIPKIIPLNRIREINIAPLNGRTVQRNAQAALKNWSKTHEPDIIPQYHMGRVGTSLHSCTVVFGGWKVDSSGENQRDASHFAAHMLLHIVEQHRLRKILFSNRK